MIEISFLLQDEEILRAGVLPDYVTLSCGQQHSALVTNSGDVYTWGKSSKGRWVCICCGGGLICTLKKGSRSRRVHNSEMFPARTRLDIYIVNSYYTLRLGHGDLIEEEGKSSPFRVELLHIQKYATSLSCARVTVPLFRKYD